MADMAAADIVVPEVQLPLSPAVPNNEKDWSVSGLVEAEEGERVRVRRHLCGLQNLSRSKRCRVPASVSDALGILLELMDGARAFCRLVRNGLLIQVQTNGTHSLQALGRKS